VVGALGPRAWWRGLSRAQRRLARTLLAVAAIVVLVGGGLLARVLTVENAERDDELALVQAEVRGDLAGMLAALGGCTYGWADATAVRSAAERACVAGARADARDPRLRRTGAVKILQVESKTVHTSLGAITASRVAWTVIGKLPVVQCVQVRRTGDFISGVHVQLLAISRPISGEGKCWKETQIEREEEEATRVEQGK